MRKFLMIFLIASTIVFSKITVWFSWEGFETFKELVLEFEKETGVKVELYNIRKIGEKLILTARSGFENLPDVVLVKNDSMQFDLFEDLSNLKLEGFSKKSIDAFTLDGKLYAVPFYFDVGGVIFYNKDLIEDPSGKTFEELVDIGKNFKGYGFLVPVYGTSFFQVFQATFGKDPIIGERIDFLDESTKRAMEYLVWLSKELGKSAFGRYGQYATFLKGRAPLFMFGSFMIPAFLGKVNFGIAEVPYVERAKRYLSPYLDFKGFAVVKGRLNDEVLKFLEFVSKSSVQEEFCSKLYKFPAKDDVFKKLAGKDEIFKRLTGYLKYGHPTPTSKLSGVYYSAVRAMLKVFMKGDYKSIDDLLRMAQEFADRETR